MVPFFMSANRAVGERGIFFDGHTSFPWTVLGVHIAAAIAILVWSIFWSTLLFGSLKYFKMLRVSTEMEFKGMDLVKHGEAAYPAGAWVEYQYNKTEKGKDGEATTNPCMSGGGVIAGTMTMDGAKTNIDGEVYNNPFEMVPTTGKLMKQMSSTFLSATADGKIVLGLPLMLPPKQKNSLSFLHAYILFTLNPLACRGKEQFKLKTNRRMCYCKFVGQFYLLFLMLFDHLCNSSFSTRRYAESEWGSGQCRLGERRRSKEVVNNSPLSAVLQQDVKNHQVNPFELYCNGWSIIVQQDVTTSRQACCSLRAT